jgi:hypothetical protein
MIAFEISLNGQRICTAGVGSRGVLHAMVTWVLRDPASAAATPRKKTARPLRAKKSDADAAREELLLQVGGLSDNTHHDWPCPGLQRGDEVLIRVSETTAVDAPSASRRNDPDRDLEAQRKYVREMCRKWGWGLTES